MGQITREERNKFQEVNRIKDVDQILEVKKVYDAVLKFMDQERAAGVKLTQIENQTRAELRGYSKTIEDAYSAYKAGNKITSNMADDMKSHIRLVTKKLIQLEQDVNTRTRGSTYKGFNQDLAVATSKSLTRVYKEQSSYARIMKQNIQRNKPIVPKIDTTPQRLPNPLDGRLPETWRDKSALLLFRKYTKKEEPRQYGPVEMRPYGPFMAYGPNRPSKKDLKKWGREDAISKFSNSTSIWQQLHNIFENIPILGKVTGAGAKISSSGQSMNKIGNTLVKMFGKFSKLGKAGALLGGPIGAAIGMGVATIGLIYQQMKKASPVLQAVSNLFELAWNLLWMPLGNMLGTVLLPLAETLINFAIAFNELFSDFSMQSILDVTMRLGEVLMATFQTLFNMLFDILITLPFKITQLLPNFVMDAIESALRACGLNEVADGIRNLRNIVNSFWDTVLQWIKGLPSILAMLPNVFLSGLKSLLSGGDFVEGVKNRWNDTIGSWTGIKLATGGIVTNPTIAMVGEAGPEAVVPLDRANGIGTTYVININGDVYGVQDLESRVERAIQRTANKAYYR